MAAEIAEKRKLLSRIEANSANDQQHIQDYEQVKQTILSLGELLKTAETQEIVALINTVIERIYVTRNGKEEICHIFIKGCQQENYEEFFAERTAENGGEFLCDPMVGREHHPHHGRGAAAPGLQ